MSQIISRNVSGRAFSLALVLALGSLTVLSAQEAAPTAPASSLSARLAAAQSVLISDARGRRVINDEGRDEAAASFYAAMRSWNRYRLVSTDASADLVFQISMVKLQLQLTIIDPQTQAVLAPMAKHVESGYLVDTRERNLNRAVSAMIDDLRRLSGPPAMTAIPPEPSASGRPPEPVQPRALPAPQSIGKGPAVFPSNGGTGSCEPDEKGRLSAGVPVHPFDQLYAALKTSGQYALVSSPAVADFVFELRCVELPETVSKWVDKPGSDKNPPEQEKVEYTIYHPQVRLIILDARTLAVLGAFSQMVKTGNRPAEQGKGFAAAIETMVTDAGRQLNRPAAMIYIPDLVDYAPVPPQIQAARTVFISNAIGQRISGGTPAANQSYNNFYATMRAWGKYELVASPAVADLIFELSSGNPLYLRILDPRTKVTLWTLLQGVQPAILESTTHKNFDLALVALIENLAWVVGKPAIGISVPQDIKDSPVPPQIGAARTAFIVNAGEANAPDGRGKTDQVYNVFYATMKKWGRYELAPTAGEADLVFHISYSVSQVRVEILDPKTMVTLWEFNQKAGDDLNQVVASLVKNTAWLAGQPMAEISIPPGVNAAPVPSGISGSRKVFVSRATEYSSRYGEKLEETQDQLYNQLVADMKSWGQYELTATPAEADLIFESYVIDDPFRDRVRLSIRDAKTRHLLWGFEQPTKTAFLSSTEKKNLNEAVDLMMKDVRRVASLSG
ncbi:MAG: hypothetical protein LAP21_00600 [Acidobacteriia bacterium]|nr:hypothetical protein [Terriglobia bacterium]